MKVGRNDPCPCGSGKKFKHCCMRETSAAPDETLWRRLRRLHDELPLHLLKFADRTFGEAALLEAWDEFHLWEGPPFEPGSPHQQLFTPWFFFHWTPALDDTETHSDAPRDTPVALAYLRYKAGRLDDLERRAVEAGLRGVFSFHDILACTPGEGFVLRDIFTGEEHAVVERLGSAHAQRGDIVLAKIVDVDGLRTLDGFAPILIPPDAKGPILELRKQMKLAGVSITTEFLHDYDLEMFGIYHAIYDEVMNPTPPELRNTDGDPLEFHKIVYDIDSAQAAFDALKPLALDASDEQLLADAERDAGGTLRGVSFAWSKRGNKIHAHWDNTILGHITIADRTLTVEVNSAKRAKQLRMLADKLLGAIARHRATTRESTEAMLERARENSDANDARHAPAEIPAEVQAEVAGFVRAHYEQWIRDKIPALGNRTPIQAMQDPEGREMVEALLLDMERHEHTLDLPGEPPSQYLRGLLASAAASGRPAAARGAGKPAARRRKTGAAPDEGVFQIKVTLQYVAPAVWRRIQVPAGVRLDTLHRILQAAMGWTESHLHGFYVGRTAYGVPNPEFPDDTQNERRVRLSEIAGEGDALVYEYDFGDGWRHSLKIEKHLPAEAGVRYPRCLTGKRACPPEDCGGPPGYAHLLDVLADPRHEEHEEMQEWLGPGFDAEAFDIDGVNDGLRRIKG